MSDLIANHNSLKKLVRMLSLPLISNLKLKYPRSIFFIISNEFCERFSFYGMRTVLTLYLRRYLKYSDNMSTVIYHVFTMLLYFFPIFGAMLADSLLGKFRTIFYLSIIYAIGQLLLSLSAAPPLGIPANNLELYREFSLFGLVLIAVGTGGIKPCVAAFGGDQFILPQQERYLSTFFSLFYFSINSGSLISTFLTPLLRSSVSCFGDSTCYSLAFLVPAILMTLSIEPLDLSRSVIFILGKPLYKIVKPTGNVVLNVSKCVSSIYHVARINATIPCSKFQHAIYRKVTSKNVKKQYWLDYADDKYDKSLINDIKSALQVMILFIPIPIFWALYDQQGSRWTFQATRMNGEIGGNFLIQPDQMQVFNPLLVLVFIPLFETCLYPLMGKIGLRTPLRILSVGGFLASLSFVAAAFVELELEKTYPILPSKDLAQLRVFNTLDCNVTVTVHDPELSIALKSMDMWEDRYIEAKGERELSYEADFSICDKAGITQLNKTQGEISVSENQATSWAITQDGLSYSYIDSIDKSDTGEPLIRGLIYVDPSQPAVDLELIQDGTVVLRLKMNSTSFHETKELAQVTPGVYDIRLNGFVIKEIPLKLGGVYTVVGSVKEKESKANVITVTEPNSMHILWLIPQYIIITMGEVMFSVTGLEFAFTQAPVSMKSLLQACWLLTVAIGNLIVVIVAEISIFDRQIFEFILFAGLMFIDIIIFSIMAKFYKYVDTPGDEDASEEIIHMSEKFGTVNASYHDDEK
ncbi:Peptide transporter family 1 [Melipona quadrifasciata]|uniref:Oligopeptide transporter 1 n=1 Tax=Melipona quadrifasciata TaxID=166423 RepID=A0A0M9A6L9_9HYME|nr:Peptide transporter family 1 [Melipona quadrifasciata]